MSKKPSNPKKVLQEDFWDLGDDDDLELENSPSPKKETEDTEEPAPEPKVESKPKAESKKEPKSKADEEPKPKAESKPKPKPESTPTPDPETLATPRKRVRVKETSPQDLPVSLLEKLALSAFVACLIAALWWGITTFTRDAPNGTLIEFTEDFPARGDSITVDGVETWWREPVRSGPDIDTGVVVDANLIPCVRIRLIEGGSTRLRVTFRDGEDNPIGDTINLTVDNGNFARNNTPEVVINATAGFENASRINAYMNEDIDPWSVSIIEDGESKEPLVRARITPNLKDN